MPENANVELVRDAYEAFIKGDLETVDKVLADDITWHSPGRSPISGTRHSKQEVFEFFGQLAERTNGTFALEVQNVLGEDDRVVVLVIESGERNGKTLRSESAHVWRIKDEKAIEFRELPEDLHAAEEFWE